MESIVPEKDVAELDAKQLEEELNKNVGVAVDYSTMTRNNLFKFLIFSAIGVWVFFIPTNIGGVSNVPMVLLIDAVKALLGSTVMNWMVPFTGSIRRTDGGPASFTICLRFLRSWWSSMSAPVRS